MKTDFRTFYGIPRSLKLHVGLWTSSQKYEQQLKRLLITHKFCDQVKNKKRDYFFSEILIILIHSKCNVLQFKHLFRKSTEVRATTKQNAFRKISEELWQVETYFVWHWLSNSTRFLCAQALHIYMEHWKSKRWAQRGKTGQTTMKLCILASAEKGCVLAS